ncbi:MAG TPA: glycosyltransferase, partial [Thermodesulfovibrionales bacterium]|nr:glycosyltransferase [Thermodesulfovibrionales bacterium]
MSKKPLISILTPVYNQKKYIGQTIRSVLSQTYQDWEWVILDDGSTDETGDIIKRFKEDRIRYVSQGHAGITNLTKTYNKAFAICHGQFIAVLDSDDYWPDYKLKMQIKNFDNLDTVLSYGVCCLVNQEGKKIMYSSLPDDPGIASNDPIGSSLKALVLKRYSFIPNLTVMVRKAALSAIGGFVDVQGLYQDFPTWTRLALEGKFAAIPQCLGFYRKHPSSITASSDPELSFESRLEFLRAFITGNKQRLDDLGFH